MPTLLEAENLEAQYGSTKVLHGLGFSVEAVRRDYYQDPREDALVLWRENLSAPDR